MSARHPVIGSWRVAVEVAGNPRPINLARLSADGGVVVAFPSPTPAAPGAGHRLEYWTLALGSWEAAGERGADLTVVSLGADENGVPIGTHTVTASITATPDGSGWQGPFRIDVAATDGSIQVSVNGTVTATPITVEPQSR